MRNAVLYGAAVNEIDVRGELSRQLGCNTAPDVQNRPDSAGEFVVWFDHAKRVNAVFTFGIQGKPNGGAVSVSRQIGP